MAFNGEGGNGTKARGGILLWLPIGALSALVPMLTWGMNLIREHDQQITVLQSELTQLRAEYNVGPNSTYRAEVATHMAKAMADHDRMYENFRMLHAQAIEHDKEIREIQTRMLRYHRGQP